LKAKRVGWLVRAVVWTLPSHISSKLSRALSCLPNPVFRRVEVRFLLQNQRSRTSSLKAKFWLLARVYAGASLVTNVVKYCISYDAAIFYFFDSGVEGLPEFKCQLFAKIFNYVRQPARLTTTDSTSTSSTNISRAESPPYSPRPYFPRKLLTICLCLQSSSTHSASTLSSQTTPRSRSARSYPNTASEERQS
jgi:hypothetical protein